MAMSATKRREQSRKIKAVWAKKHAAKAKGNGAVVHDIDSMIEARVKTVVNQKIREALDEMLGKPQS